MGRGEHSEVLDPRSTGRKRARKVLESTGRPYECECKGSCGLLSCGAYGASDGRVCGWKPTEQTRSQTLDANHINKNWLDNDPANLEWLCRKCHKALDSRSEAGVMHDDELAVMYGDMFLEIPPDIV